MCFQFVEFSGTNLDEGNDVVDDDTTSQSDSIVRMPDPNADKANLNPGKPLENLLMSKNRKIQEQLTTLRVRLPLLSRRLKKLMSEDRSLTKNL